MNSQNVWYSRSVLKYCAKGMSKKVFFPVQFLLFDTKPNMFPEFAILALKNDDRAG